MHIQNHMVLITIKSTIHVHIHPTTHIVTKLTIERYDNMILIYTRLHTVITPVVFPHQKLCSSRFYCLDHSESTYVSIH